MTNPTERPEDLETMRWDAEYRMWNPTERPEERDSLATAQSWVDCPNPPCARHQDPLPALLTHPWSKELVRTLINEVKERDERIAEKLTLPCSGCGRPWRNSDHVYGVRACCPNCSHFPAQQALEAEVKELREENVRLQLENRQASIERRTRPELARIKQMEEALRGVKVALAGTDTVVHRRAMQRIDDVLRGVKV